MKLINLSIKGFGKFHDRTFSFEDGINVLYGKNEAGKSTMHSFIRAMLYGMERGRGRASKTDLFSKYEPWNDSALYEGVMRIEKDKHIYRIERNFGKNSKAVSVIDETSGIAINSSRTFFDDIMCGLSETAYSNTISIGQLKSATDDGMVSELKNYIANMNTTGNMALNINKATTYLKDQKKSYSSQIIPEAAKAYASNLSEIKNIETEISSPEYINSITSLKEEKSQALKQSGSAQETKENLIKKIASDKQILKSNNFESKDDIYAMLTDAEDSYNDYMDSKIKKDTKALIIWQEIFLIFACLFLGGAGYIFFKGQENFISHYLSISYSFIIYSLLSASAALFIGAFIFIFISSVFKRHYKICLSKISDLLKVQLGDGSVSDDAMSSLRTRCREFELICDSLRTDERKLLSISDEITNLGLKQETYSGNIEEQQRSQWELEKKLEHLTNLKDENIALRKTIAENNRIQFEIESIDLAHETMSALSTSIRDSFGLYLNKEASDLINGITGGIYNSMSIDENLNIFMNTKDKLVPIDQVSSGTIDQIYLALRLATAKLMQGDSDALPLFFDDSFVNYDEDRLKVALKWLSSAYSGQIIIFTCHKREAQLLTANLINYNFIEL